MRFFAGVLKSNNAGPVIARINHGPVTRSKLAAELHFVSLRSDGVALRYTTLHFCCLQQRSMGYYNLIEADLASL
jgi:hypothetical protein